jgi:hypothetical protein
VADPQIIKRQYTPPADSDQPSSDPAIDVGGPQIIRQQSTDTGTQQPDKTIEMEPPRIAGFAPMLPPRMARHTTAAIAQGALNLPEGITQSASVDLPEPLQRLQKSAEKAPWSPVWQGIGSLPWSEVGPARIIGPIESGLGGLARTAVGGIRGALGGLFMPQDKASDFWKGGWRRAGLGGLFGSLFGAAGSPVSKDAQKLLDNDIRITPISLLPAGNEIERRASYLPGFGETIQMGVNTTMRDFNRRVYQWIDPTTKGMPITVGSEGLNFLFNRITAKANQAYSQLTLRPMTTPGFGRAFAGAWQQARAHMSPGAFSQFNAAIENYFAEPMRNANWQMGGGGLAKMSSDFSKLARDQMRGSNLSQDNFALAQAYRDMRRVFTSFANGPQAARDLRDQADTQFAKYFRAEGAAASAGVTSEGIFTPRSFLAAQSRAYGSGVFQRDAIPFADAQEMKDIAEAANAITGRRGYYNQPWATALGGAAYLHEGAPYAMKLAPALGVSALLHSPPGMSGLAAAARSATRQNVAPYLAQPAGSVVGYEAPDFTLDVTAQRP